MSSTYNIPYPEMYYRIYPKVINIINKNEDELILVNNISKEQIEEMVDEVCKEMIKECPEIGEDPMDRRRISPRRRKRQRIYYSRGRLLRDIAGIVLISELLRRRYPYNYYGY